MQQAQSARIQTPTRARFVLIVSALVVSTLTASGSSSADAEPAADPAAPPDDTRASSGAASSSPDSTSTSAGVAGTSTRFSDPVYYPLRYSNLWSLNTRPSGGPYSAKLGCVQSNCTDHQSGGHDRWAIDLVADRGDAVHAAGRGILHIEAINYDCTTEGPRGGTALWIDHGGGVVSIYRHLSAIEESLVGEVVGPQTKIGEVGRSGNTCGVDPYYLHFEIRRGGLHGTPIRFDQLLACRSADRAISLPAAMGYASWDDVPYRGPAIPATGSNCMQSWAQGMPAEPVMQAAAGDGRVELAWELPYAADGVAIEKQIFRPSTGEFSRGIYRYLGETSTFVDTDVTNGRRYRYRVALHHADGYTEWSELREVSPAGPPGASDIRRLVATSSRIGIGWTKADPNGRPIESYLLAIRKETASGWAPWQYTARPPDSTTFNWYDRRPGTRYQVRVRGRSAAGAAPWTRQEITTAP